MTDAVSANPLAEGIQATRRAPPGVLVVFGASGDLTKRKLLPALGSLSRRRLLAASFAVVGVARTPLDDAGFRDLMMEAVPDVPGWEEVVKLSRYVTGDYDDPETFSHLKTVLDDLEEDLGHPGIRTYYLATVPAMF